MKMKIDLHKKLLAIAFVVPLNTNTQWQQLKYNKIEPNKVTFSPAGLNIAVKNSASPLVFPLSEPKLISGFKLRLKISGKIANSDSLEDNYLRVGLVVPGKRRLNAVQRMMAAPWVKELFKLAPKDSGIDKIYFYGLTDKPELIGKSREHPKSDLIFETIAAKAQTDGKEFEIEYKLSEPKKVAAIWLAADGDDTKSSFTVDILKLELVE